MDKKISEYISENKVMTIATSVNNIPYCANCFYVFDEEKNILIFLSDDTTRHIKEALLNRNVAGTINTEVTTVAKIKGIQFVGEFIQPNEEEKKLFYDTYYNKFSFAKAKPSLVWGIKLHFVKMTDNTLGFATKLKWKL